MTIGKNIRIARERLGLEQKDCAERLGVARSTWSDWEADVMAPRAARLPAIAKVLRVKPGRLVA